MNLSVLLVTILQFDGPVGFVSKLVNSPRPVLDIQTLRLLVKNQGFVFHLKISLGDII